MRDPGPFRREVQGRDQRARGCRAGQPLVQRCTLSAGAPGGLESQARASRGGRHLVVSHSATSGRSRDTSRASSPMAGSVLDQIHLIRWDRSLQRTFIAWFSLVQMRATQRSSPSSVSCAETYDWRIHFLSRHPHPCQRRRHRRRPARPFHCPSPLEPGASCSLTRTEGGLDSDQT
jgi:hypothetical protein